MVTRHRPRQTPRAIEHFVAQSDANRQLADLDDGEPDPLPQGVKAIRIRRIRLHRKRQAGRSMGELQRTLSGRVPTFVGEKDRLVGQ